MTEQDKKTPARTPVRPLKIRILWLCLWCIAIIAFLIWIKCLWGVIVLPFFFDFYITRKINWNWWRQLRSRNARIIMSWVDAIVFAVVAAYFVNIYFFQNFVIPSSSLEKSLLVGDYLFVSKVSYGPRKPMTPLSIPMVANNLPITGTKSYIEWPKWGYERVRGLGKIKLNDIVVFNYPSGDTVATAQENQDYYGLCYQAGAELYPIGDMSSMNFQQRADAFAAQYAVGRSYIISHPEQFGKVISRPVDHRTNYVKRCVGLPGQTLQIKHGIVYLNGKPDKEPDKVQYGYIVTFRTDPPVDLLKELEISQEDLSEASPYDPMVRYMPLTRHALRVLRSRKDIVKSIAMAPAYSEGLYPLDMAKSWTTHDYGPVLIPRRGLTVKLDSTNYALYERPIRIYEGNRLELRDGRIYINGRRSDRYTFRMDYYWMMGDNRDRSADSRFWGFVPEDHIVGKPIFIWLSLDKDYSLFNGKIRWSRIFRKVDNIR